MVHAVKCITLCFWIYILCVLGAVFVKYMMYRLIGVVFNCEPTTAMDDFWLYDFPINPINIPSAMIINKPKMEPEEMIK